MTKQGTILVVDDNKGILTAVQMLLGTYFEKVITISTPNKIKATLHDENIDVVLLDMNFSAGINTGNEGLFWLSEIKKEDASIQVVLFTAYADIDLAVRGIKEGAADFVVKPWDNAKLLETLKTAYNIRTANRKGISIATDKLVVSKESGMFWGESNAMQQLRSLIEKVARTDANILVTGENGTGKEMLAREIHLLSNRKKETLVPVDMGAITETLFESELFGHVKGAFTGAVENRKGLLKAADGGLLFLDEIGELGLDEQAMLLAALEEKRFFPLGSDSEVTSDFQLICGTNKNLSLMVKEKKFREDLLARIQLWSFNIPSLKDRHEDIEPNLDYELQQVSLTTGNLFSFNKEAREKFLSLSNSSEALWKSNFRDLSGAVTRMSTLSEGGRITESDVESEWNRLLRQWYPEGQTESEKPSLPPVLSEEQWKELDLFDRCQLEKVIEVCQSSKNLADASRKLFAHSLSEKKSTNNSDRLRKYLAKFGLSWTDLHKD